MKLTKLFAHLARFRNPPAFAHSSYSTYIIGASETNENTLDGASDFAPSHRLRHPLFLLLINPRPSSIIPFW